MKIINPAKAFAFVLAAGWAVLLSPASLHAEEIAGIPRDSNFNNTGGYDSSRIEAQFVVPVRDTIDVIHFIRDNNDPRVITKTYLLKNVDPYEFRDYLRQMVQSKRVGNATLQQQYPGNAANSSGLTSATVSSAALTAANAQPGYTPQVQLGSNTAVECLKYVDGTGLLIVSAEEYRFTSNENGIGIDELVAILDDPALGDLNYGSQMFIYMPRFVPARNLLPLIQNVGMNISDVTELWQGQDLVAYDPDLNWLIFDVENYSCENISNMLKKYDVPIPQVRLRITVYEIYHENDDKIGIDFQSWKNNEGADFFSIGGRYRNNWGAMYGDGLGQSLGSERTSYYNFNPKWNSRYLDLLASEGRASVIHTGELCIRNNSFAEFSRTTKIFYDDVSEMVKGASQDPTVGPAKLLSAIIGKTIEYSPDIPVAKGEAQKIQPAETDFGFTMTVNNVSVNLAECSFNITLTNTSLIGFASNGTPRIAPGNTVNQVVSLPFGKNSFVIGGLKKQETIKSKTGVPYLMDIPILEYIFSSVSTSVKTSELVVYAQCEWASPSEHRTIAKGSAK